MVKWQRKPVEENTWGRKSRKSKTKTFTGMASLYAASAEVAPAAALAPPCQLASPAPAAPGAKRRGRPPKLNPDGTHKPPRRKVNNTLTERFEQEKVVVHCTKQGYVFFAIPNAARRTFWEAMLAKKSGMKAGVPDLCFPVPRNGFHGMYVEMKRIEGGIVSPIQHYWLAFLKAQGYKTDVCHGAQDAIAFIDAYFAGWEGQGKNFDAMLEAINLEKQKAYEDKLLQERADSADGD
jgi:hypothetical protein